MAPDQLINPSPPAAEILPAPASGPEAVQVPPGAERYLTPEFTRQLLEHLHAAKKLALQDAAAEGHDGRT